MNPPENPDEILRAKLNQETSRIAWTELQRFFAAGSVIAVGEKLDLIEVAVQVSNDNKAQVKQWLSAHEVGKVSDAQAKAWLDADATLWAVVVNPWILVQHKGREAYH